MRRNKCADTSGLVAECFIYGNLDLHKCPLDVFNHMLTVGRFDESWSHTVFTMLPKGGNLLSPNNWRPVAVLKISFKIFCTTGLQAIEAETSVQRSSRIQNDSDPAQV